MSAARKVARTIFLGSAPSVREQHVRGLETVRVLLGTTMPDDQIAVYSDALGRLGDRAAHLYEQSGRYWFDDQPTLRKVMEERAQRIDHDDVLAEIERRLHAERPRGVFRGVHQCPDCGNVSDEQQVRLVILGPEQTHRNGRADTPGMAAAWEILSSRGTVPRQHKNMLLFVAPDEVDIRDVGKAAREYLAWASIIADREALNLDVQQTRQAEEGKRRANTTTDDRLKAAYHWLLVPEQEGTKQIEIKPVRIAGTDGIVERRPVRLNSQAVIATWGPELLRIELDRWHGRTPRTSTRSSSGLPRLTATFRA